MTKCKTRVIRSCLISVVAHKAMRHIKRFKQRVLLSKSAKITKPEEIFVTIEFESLIV